MCERLVIPDGIYLLKNRDVRRHDAVGDRRQVVFLLQNLDVFSGTGMKRVILAAVGTAVLPDSRQVERLESGAT